MTFKPGDKVRSKLDFEILTIKNVPSQAKYAVERADSLETTCDFTDGEWDFMKNYKLITEEEDVIKEGLGDNLDKAIEIRQLKEELDIVYQALDYCVSKINNLTVERFWQVETIKKMIELRNSKNKG